MYLSMTTNLMVENVEVSLRFYQEILGFSVGVMVPKESGGLQFAILEKDGISLMIQDRENFIEEYPILDTQKIQPSISLYISVDNLEELYQNLQEKYEILKEMYTTFYGSKEFAVADADGYVLTFTEAK